MDINFSEGLGLGLLCAGNWRKPLTDKLYHIMIYRVHRARGFKLTTLVVIGTDWIGSCKSNQHTITTTSIPFSKGHNCIMYMYLIQASEILLCNIAAILYLGSEKLLNILRLIIDHFFEFVLKTGKINN